MAGEGKLGSKIPQTGGPTGDAGEGRPRKLRGRQRPRLRGLPGVYPRSFNFHEASSYDLPIEQMLQVR